MFLKSTNSKALIIIQRSKIIEDYLIDRKIARLTANITNITNRD